MCGEPGPMPGRFKPLRGWLWWINAVLAVPLIGLLIAFVIMSFVMEKPPYDYALLINGADYFCFRPENFRYGEDLHIYYPAPFYSTFCLPNRYVEPVMRWVWMLLPALAVLWLARGRAVVLVYPPLGVLLLIGQSSWLVLPAYAIAAWERNDRPIRVWYGILLAAGIFKPHLTLPVWLWLAWRWWRRGEWRTLAVWALAATAIVLPAFVLRPAWLIEWLPNGRGFEPVNLASLALVPVQLGQMGFAPGPAGLVVVFGFCLLAAGGIALLLRWRRRYLAFYDWALVFFLANPFLNDYDLIALLPFVAPRPRRLLLALTAGVVTWLFAMFSGTVSPHYRWSMSLLVTHTGLAGGAAVARRGHARHYCPTASVIGPMRCST